MTPRHGPALLLPLLLALAACGGDDPPSDTAAVSAAEAPADGSTAAGAPQGATAEMDARALANYRLNEQDLRRWMEVMRSPEQRAALEDQTDSDGEGVSSLVTLVERNPEYRAVVERAGLTPTRFAIISHVVIAAVSAREAAKTGMDADSVAWANGIDPANVGFVAEHEDEIRQIMEM